MLFESIKLTKFHSEIFEVAFVPGSEHSSNKKRVITKAFAAFGHMKPIPNSHSATPTSRAKGRVQKRSPGLQSVEARKSRSTASKVIMKQHREARIRK